MLFFLNEIFTDGFNHNILTVISLANNESLVSLVSSVNIVDQFIKLVYIVSMSYVIILMMSFAKTIKYAEDVKDDDNASSTDLVLYQFRDPNPSTTYPIPYLNFLRVHGSALLISTMLRGNNKVTSALINGVTVPGILLENNPSTVSPITQVSIRVIVPAYREVIAQTALTSDLTPIFPQSGGRIRVNKNAVSDVKILD